MGGSAVKNLRMFQRLGGEDGMHGVVIATTMWDVVRKDMALSRENELMTTQGFWAPMIATGSRVFRLDTGAY